MRQNTRTQAERKRVKLCVRHSGHAEAEVERAFKSVLSAVISPKRARLRLLPSAKSTLSLGRPEEESVQGPVTWPPVPFVSNFSSSFSLAVLRGSLHVR